MKEKIGGEEVRQKHEKRQKDKEETEWHKDRIRGKTKWERQSNKRDRVTGNTEYIKKK